MFAQSKKAFQNFKRVSSYLFSRDNASSLVQLSISVLTTSALNIGAPFLFNTALSLLYNNENTEVLGSEITPFGMVGIYGAAWFLARMSQALQKIIVSPIAVRSAEKVTVKYLNHLMHLSLNYHISTPVGKHIDLLSKSFAGMQDFTKQLMTQIVPTTLEVSTVAILLSVQSDPLIGLGLAIMLSCCAVYNACMARRVAKAQQERLEADIEAFGQIMAVVTNFETVHLFNNVGPELNRLQKVVSKMGKFVTRSLVIPDKISAGQMIFIGAGFITLILNSCKEAISKNSVQDFVIVSYYLVLLSAPLASFGDAVNKLRACLVDLTQLMNFLETPPQVIDAFPEKSLQVYDTTADIVFKDIRFCYEGRDTPVLDGVNFEVPAGKKTAIVGTSGGGKSTLVKLLMRFCDYEGSIKINGQEIREFSFFSVRNIFGIVPQMPVLFNDTLGNNVRYGALSSNVEVTDDEVYAAIEKACLIDFVRKQKEGLNTQLGEGGSKVSGGERQRIALARMLIKKPQILIYDEATAALDIPTELEVQKNLDEVSIGKTTLVIAHRLSTIINADQIIVMDKGKVAERGTHDQLLAKKGIYAGMWEQQSRGSVVSVSSTASFLAIPPPKPRGPVGLVVGSFTQPTDELQAFSFSVPRKSFLLEDDANPKRTQSEKRVRLKQRLFKMKSSSDLNTPLLPSANDEKHDDELGNN